MRSICHRLTRDEVGMLFVLDVMPRYVTLLRNVGSHMALRRGIILADKDPRLPRCGNQQTRMSSGYIVRRVKRVNEKEEIIKLHCPY